MGNNRVAIFGIVLMCLQLIACTEENEHPITLFDPLVLIDADAYNSGPTDQLTINSLEIVGDSLKVNFSSSGCSGESWEVKLIDSGSVMYSNPPQRNLILSFKNKELCEAYITKEVSFAISSLQVDGADVWLNITNTNKRILYTY